MTRPLPRAEGPTAPYWEALRRREFLLPYDPEQDRFLHPINSFKASGLEWLAAPQDGTVESYSWIHLPTEGYDDLPYILATVALDKGPQLMCNIVETDLAEVRIGGRVRLVFEEREDGWVVPQFCAAGAAAHPQDAGTSQCSSGWDQEEQEERKHV